jgi:histidinol-phosphate aminotransferase
LKRSILHNLNYAKKIKNFLEKFNIYSNEIAANFLLLDFSKCKFKAKHFYEKLLTKGIVLRSTEDGYKIKNMLRLTIGSKNDNLKFLKVVENIFKK